MTMYTHTVVTGENPWSYVRDTLSQKASTSNADIVRNLTNLAKENGCASIEEFGKKFFNKAGKTFSCATLDTNVKADSETQKYITDTLREKFDSMFVSDAVSFNRDTLVYKTQQNFERNWSDIQAAQNRINNLKSNKEKVIAYNRDFNDSRENYIIVDKKTYTATVYSWDGKVIKEFEVGIGKEKSDALLRRSYKNKEYKFESTSAGIYTINYRATGKDVYKKLYNDKLFTLSNDGLKDKGIGNGETGVALHQIPNGNKNRYSMLDRDGVSDENNRFSNGCVNFRSTDFDDIAELISGVGTKVYILPEDENNYMTVKNGKLHFTQKKYSGDVATTTTKNDPIKNVKIVSNKNFGGESDIMMQTLSDYKQELAKDLGIDNDIYNELAKLTLGIAGQESEFGSLKAIKYHVKEKAPWLVTAWKKVKGFFGVKESPVNSRGLTQIKLAVHEKDPANKAMLAKYNINEKNLNEGNNAAIATMIILANMYKNELPSLKSKMDSLNLSVSDALLYCWQGRKSQILKESATPEKSFYHKNVKEIMKNIDIKQSA